MSEPNDPNAKYEPVAYPRMLYATPTNTLTVYDEREEEHARQAGYTDFDKIDPERDGLEFLSLEALIDIAVMMVRAKLVKAEPKDIIEGIRDMRARDAEEEAGLAAKPEPDLDGDFETGVATVAVLDPEADASDDETGGPLDEQAPNPEAEDLRTDDELRAFITGRDGKAPHHKLGRGKLLALAGPAPEAMPEAVSTEADAL